MITKKYELELLTKDYVNVTVKSFATIEDNIYLIKTEGKSYCNSEMGRQFVNNELPTEYVNTIFTLWGDSCTIEDPPYSGPIEN
jgi:hypothetical protein